LPVLQKTIFIRTLTEYDASRDSALAHVKGLSFQFGDVLQANVPLGVDTTMQWWQARRVLPWSDTQLQTGFIPSLHKLTAARENECRYQQRTESVGEDVREFEPKDKKRRSLILSKKNPVNKLTTKLRKTSTSGSTNKPMNGDHSPAVVQFYQPVSQTSCKYTRPVILFGMFKDRIDNDLVTEQPTRFASCVPHTTRPIRRGEVDGLDYYFVNSREQMEREVAQNRFVEAGVFSGQLYGTSVDSIKSVAQQNKHCILDVSVSAIPRLVDHALHPISILVRPVSANIVSLLNKPISEDAARTIYAGATKLYNDSKHLFTAVVSGDSYQEIYRKSKQVITDHSQSMIWISTDETFEEHLNR
jgi:guanylate kinase